MKYLTLVFAGISFCFSGLVRAEVFYCSEDNRAGIKWDESRPVTFKPGRLKINVDFENNTLHSPDATLLYERGFGTRCSKKHYVGDNTTYIHCSSELGVALMFNINSYKFSSAMYVEGQDMYVSYGSCEPF